MSQEMGKIQQKSVDFVENFLDEGARESLESYQVEILKAHVEQALREQHDRTRKACAEAVQDMPEVITDGEMKDGEGFGVFQAVSKPDAVDICNELEEV